MFAFVKQKMQDMDLVTQSIESELVTLQGISLEEMSAVKLMNRTDTKYVISVRSLFGLLDFAREKGYSVQETDGKRLASYKTTYYDTAGLGMLVAHICGKLTRQKVRIRTYVDSSLTFIEIKKKNNHGRTKKKRIVTPLKPGDMLSGETADFVSGNSAFASVELSPALSNTFRRMTLVNPQRTERITIDMNISFENHRMMNALTLPDLVVVELKRDGMQHSTLQDWMNDNRIRKAGFSKYAYGQVLTAPTVPLKNMKPKVRRLIKRHLVEPKTIVKGERFVSLVA